jgi:hypothetical protein
VKNRSVVCVWLPFALAAVVLPASRFAYPPQHREWDPEGARAALGSAGFEVRYESEDRVDDDGCLCFSGLYVARPGAAEAEWAAARRNPPHSLKGEVAVLVVIGQPERRPRVARVEGGAPYACGDERLVAEILRALR